jgi:hypothetical protein
MDNGIAYCAKCGEYLGDYVNGILYKFGQQVRGVHRCKAEPKQTEEKVMEELREAIEPILIKRCETRIIQSEIRAIERAAIERILTEIRKKAWQTGQYDTTKKGYLLNEADLEALKSELLEQDKGG